MTKQELIDTYFESFLAWCASAPEGKPYNLIFWLEHRTPTEDNFWEYMVHMHASKLAREVERG